MQTAIDSIPRSKAIPREPERVPQAELDRLTHELAATAAEYDRTGTFPAENLRDSAKSPTDPGTPLACGPGI